MDIFKTVQKTSFDFFVSLGYLKTGFHDLGISPKSNKV